MQRLAKGWGGVLTLYVRDEDGDLADATGTVTVSVANAAGTVVASGNASKTAATTGTYTFACTAAQLSTMGLFTATWAATVSGVSITPVTQVEVVGSHLFGVDELRAKRIEFDNTSKYPTATLVAARTEVTEWLEDVMHVALVPRRKRLVTKGDGTDTLLTGDPLITALVSVTVDGTAWDVTGITGNMDIGELVAPSGDAWTKDAQIIAMYDHGYAPTPEPVKRAALTLAVERALPSVLNPRATVESTDVGAFRLSIARPDTPTGIPDVDVVISEYGYRRPGA